MTSARRHHVLEVLDACSALVEQERHVELHELVERVDHLLHQRLNFAVRRLDLGELALDRGHLGLLRLDLRVELLVVALEAVRIGHRLSVATGGILRLLASVVDLSLLLWPVPYRSETWA